MPLGPSHCANFEKILSTCGALRVHNNFGSKMAHLPQPDVILGKPLI